jgi:hypothetical protein
MSKKSFLNDKKYALVVQTTYGEDTNYAPFSTLYADIVQRLDDPSEINEELYMKCLVKLGIIERRSGRTFPPLATYERMKGPDGLPKIGFYCKKHSVIAKTNTDTFGICLSELSEFKKLYYDEIGNMLEELGKLIADEKAEADAYFEMQAEKYKERRRIGSLRKKVNAMFTSGKASVIESFFKN